jgi:hypothetical protein
MKLRQFSMIALAVPVLLFVILGCGTSAKSLRWEDVGLGHKTLAEGGVKVSARYLDKKALYTLHGRDNNPFAEYPASLFVVDVTVESEAPVGVRAGEAVLTTVMAPKRPVQKEKLESLWRSTLEYNNNSRSSGPNQFSGYTIVAVSDVIKKTCLPDAATVEAGGKVSGYLLFSADHEDKGPATFTIPVYDAAGGAVGEFKFEFTL